MILRLLSLSFDHFKDNTNENRALINFPKISALKPFSQPLSRDDFYLCLKGPIDPRVVRVSNAKVPFTLLAQVESRFELSQNNRQKAFPCTKLNFYQMVTVRLLD
jgi:hypothetical protein